MIKGRQSVHLSKGSLQTAATETPLVFATLSRYWFRWAKELDIQKAQSSLCEKLRLESEFKFKKNMLNAPTTGMELHSHSLSQGTSIVCAKSGGPQRRQIKVY